MVFVVYLKCHLSEDEFVLCYFCNSPTYSFTELTSQSYPMKSYFLSNDLHFPGVRLH